MSFEYNSSADPIDPPHDDGIAIRIKDVSKCHHIYSSPGDRLRQFVFPRLQSSVGRHRKAYFSEFWGLRNISFDVRRGETVGVIGRNGAGKSTLLQIICGTLTPTTGSVETKGRVAALLELGAGFNPEFTGRENVYLNAALLGLNRREVDERFDDIAGFADIGEFLQQPVKTYSTGMAVRLAFAVQAAIDPDVLIVDEALAVGDEKFQRKCFARLEKLRSNGCSILFVSHSPASVIELCDRVILLEKGERLMYQEASKTVRAYQKLIYAPREEQERLVQLYKRVDHSGGGMESEVSAQLSSVDVKKSMEAFDPELVPETTMAYAVQGAIIESMHILNSEGAQVNVLAPGCEYRFVVAGRFLRNLSSIYFGIHIKSITGVEITGQRHPVEGEYIEHVKADESFRINYGFKTTMLPGVYFVGGGVWSYEDPTCLHRILDALMFRVASEGSAKCFGYMDASTGEPLLELF